MKKKIYVPSHFVFKFKFQKGDLKMTTTGTRTRKSFNLGQQSVDSHERDLNSYHSFCAALQTICKDAKVILVEQSVKYKNAESFTVKHGNAEIKKDIYKDLTRQWPNVTVERASTHDTVSFKYKKSDMEISKQQYDKEWRRMISIVFCIIFIAAILYAT